MQHDPSAALTFPFDEPPGPGRLTAVAPGVRWLRLPLPYRLDHVNIYLIENGTSWTAVDTGLGTDESKEAWEAVIAGPAWPGSGVSDRHAFPSGSCRSRRVADQTFWSGPGDATPRIPAQPVAAIRTGRSGGGRVPALLSNPRSLGRSDRDRVEPRARISEPHHRCAGILPSHQAWRHAGGWPAGLPGADRRRP